MILNTHQVSTEPREAWRSSGARPKWLSVVTIRAFKMVVSPFRFSFSVKMRWLYIVALTFLRPVTPKSLVSNQWEDFAVKHTWSVAPEGWKLHAPNAPANHTFNMRIGLKQDRFDDLVTALYEVSDPFHIRCVFPSRQSTRLCTVGPMTSCRHGQHLSKEVVEALVAPHPDTIGLVDSWLSSYGIDPSGAQRQNGGSWITVDVSVEQASRMLNATYGMYRHERTLDYVVRTSSYSLPRTLHGHIDVITPTTNFDGGRTMKPPSLLRQSAQKRDSDLSLPPGLQGALASIDCDFIVVPSCLRALYKTDKYVPNATDKNSIGVVGYLDQFANEADLQVRCEAPASHSLSRPFR